MFAYDIKHFPALRSNGTLTDIVRNMDKLQALLLETEAYGYLLIWNLVW